MAKKSNHITVVLTQDYAGKIAGDKITCDGMLASSLVQRGLAQYNSPEQDNSKMTAPVVTEAVSKPQSSTKKKEKK
jgi:hypothetical protein